MKLCEWRHACAVEAVSQSHAWELMTGSFIQSHWPCRMLWPSSMFSRIFATESVLIPSSQAGHHDEARSSMRPIRPSRRCRSMIDRMYFASRSPRSSFTCSWSSSNSLPIASSCSGVSLWSGFSGSATLDMILLELDLDGPLRGMDAGANRLALVAADLAAAQVPDAARAQGPDARVADALAAAEGQVQPGLLARDQDRGAAVALRLAVALEELDRAALALLTAADLGLEALHVHALAVALALPVLVHGVEHLPRAGDERLALAPVGAQALEILWLQAPVGLRVLLVEVEAVVLGGQLAQLVPEDDLLRRARRVQDHDVVERVAVLERPDHAHD